MIVAVLLALVGITGAIVPALPGPPLNWLALLIIYLALDGAVSSAMLWTMLAVTVMVTLLDYVAPSLMTRWGGGSQAATRGATIGTILGIFFMPWGLLLGPLAGAFVGEMMHTQNAAQSIRVALYSFLSFLLTTGAKLIASIYMTLQVGKAVWQLMGVASWFA